MTLKEQKLLIKAANRVAYTEFEGLSLYSEMARAIFGLVITLQNINKLDEQRILRDAALQGRNRKIPKKSRKRHRARKS
jgi:hypothetical protein